MPTLKQLWEQNGCKPVRVRRPTWPEEHWLFIHGVTPKGKYFGYCDDDEAITTYKGHDTDWQITLEHRRKKTLYPAIIKTNKTYLMTYTLYEDFEQAQKYDSRAIGLGPAIEVDDT